MEKSEILNSFINSNKNLMEQPIVKSFLMNEENYNIFEQAICYPTAENKTNLDLTFKQYYAKARTIKYMSMLIHFSAIEYDKKLRSQQKRYSLTLDQPINSEEGKVTTLLDTIKDNNHEMLDNICKDKTEFENLTEYFSCRYLISAINKLKPKQKLIFKYKYIDNLKNKEIAELFNDTSQNISKINKKAIEKIKKYIEEGQK